MGGDTTKRDMLINWYHINLAETIVFQRDINFFASEEDRMISNWVKDLLTNSSKYELNQRLDDKFKNLYPLNQGGIT